jgi:hypothetical protein
MHKKGFLGITIGMLIVVAIIIFVWWVGLSFFTWLMGVTLWRLIGSIMIIIVLLSYPLGNPVPPNIAIPVLIVGGILVLLPFFHEVFSLQTVGRVLGISP